MIHELPAPIRGNDRVQRTGWKEFDGSGAVIWFRLGTVTGGEFVPDRLIGEVRRQITKTEMDAVRARAAQAGAPVQMGVQAFRPEDVVAVLDAEGWLPRGMQ